MECFGGAASRSEGASKAQTRSGNPVDGGRFLNEATHQVVEEQMHAEFAFSGLRTAAAEVFHLKGRLQGSQAQLHLPPAQVEGGKLGRWEPLAVQQGRHHHNFLAPKPWLPQPTTNQPQREFLGQLIPKQSRHGAGWNDRFGPANQTFLRPQPLPASKIASVAASGPDDDIDAPSPSPGQCAVVAEPPVREQDLARAY